MIDLSWPVAAIFLSFCALVVFIVWILTWGAIHIKEDDS